MISELAALIAQASDMMMEDLFCEDQVGHSGNSPRSIERSESCRQKSPLVDNHTALHETCRAGSLEDLVRRLQTPPSNEVRMTADREKKVIHVVPTEEVMTRNPEGQLPLHLAAMNRRMIQEVDGMKNQLEDAHQPAPVMLAFCL